MSDDLPKWWPRFASKFTAARATECWEWNALLHKGYGRIWVEGRHQFAHRLSYQVFVGSIPDGLVLDHLCRNPPCVNPKHLEAVPIGTNTLRGLSPAAMAAARDHCPEGHPYTPENTYRRLGNGSRTCRTCKAAWFRAYRAKHTAAGKSL